MKIPLKEYWFSLKEAKRLNVCRICRGNPGGPRNPFILNYGYEFAHKKCLIEANRKRSKN